MKIVKQKVELLSTTKDAFQLIEFAGRTCYKSESKITEDSAVDFVKMIIKRRHGSVLEHASATFKITTDRGITHEIVRHRLASYSQESTRYVKYGDIEVIAPILKDSSGELDKNTEMPFTKLSESEQIWICSCMHSERLYKELIDAGEPPEVARDVLPTCLKAEIVITANFREWRHFYRMRSAKGAHPKIRVIAEQIREHFESIGLGELFYDFNKEEI